LSTSTLSDGDNVTVIGKINNCSLATSSPETFIVITLDRPSAGDDKTISCENDTVTLDGSSLLSNVIFRWSGDLGNNDTVIATIAGTYILTITDIITGCSASDEVTVNPRRACGTNIAMPTAFSPNNDGKNDVYKAVYTSEPDAFELNIYNRWGERVFQTNNINSGWDGKFKGADAPVETYTWWISYTATDGSKKAEIGTFSLLR
jgi:gliding motility-associated-like protein